MFHRKLALGILVSVGLSLCFQTLDLSRPQLGESVPNLFRLVAMSPAERELALKEDQLKVACRESMEAFVSEVAKDQSFEGEALARAREEHLTRMFELMQCRLEQIEIQQPYLGWARPQAQASWQKRVSQQQEWQMLWAMRSQRQGLPERLWKPTLDELSLLPGFQDRQQRLACLIELDQQACEQYSKACESECWDCQIHDKMNQTLEKCRESGVSEQVLEWADGQHKIFHQHH